jgi:CarboxypepD_reg-like domain
VKKSFIIFALLLSYFAHSQTNTQTIKGRVIDQQSKSRLVGVTVAVMTVEPMKGNISDLNGAFRLTDIPLGRHTLKVSLIGYTDQIIPNVLVTAGKENIIDIELEERINTLQEVSVRAVGQKTNIERGLTPVSAKTFDAEESRRYAGSRNDVARMAAGFAGVVLTNDNRNDIIIRGNSPTGLLWKLEGVDIPNPNHFGALGVTGGPVSMLNNNVLAKSSFLTGAFPSVYGNATAGVFDLQMRNGNADKREYMAQMGFNGLEAGAEGYFSKNSQASYLVNYRYSFLGLLQKLGVNFGTGSALPRYQDLTFKVNIPTLNLGTFAVFGLSGKSGIGFEPSTDANFYSSTSENLNYKTNVNVIGLSNTFFFSNKTYGKLTLSTSRAGVMSDIDEIAKTGDKVTITPNYRENSYEQRSTLNYVLNTKFNAKNTLTIAAIINNLSMHYLDSSYDEKTKRFITGRDFDGSSTFMQTYVNWQWRPSNALNINAGLYSQRLTLNGSQSLEPRLGLRYNVSPRANFSLGLGRHGQLQGLQIYFNKKQTGATTYTQPNQNLGFTFSNHAVLGYQQRLSDRLSLKVEGYYQALSGVPVDSKPSAFSLVNSGSDFGVVDRIDLVNNGTGRNYGIDLTLERTFNKYYYLISASVYESKYKGSDGIERNTFYAGQYVANVLAGREFKLGRKSVLAFDTKITSAGGKRFTPIDLEASRQAGSTVRDATHIFEGQFKDYFRADIKVTVRRNGKHAMQEWFVDINNVSNNQNIFSQNYSPTKNAIVTSYQLGLYPNINYRIVF